jgi:hypothetical protein
LYWNSLTYLGQPFLRQRLGNGRWRSGRGEEIKVEMARVWVEKGQLADGYIKEELTL